jgi:two-component system sensor histidine kinase KdpD
VIALALGRAELEEEGIRRRALEETDKLRTALLQSVSHDLRTPLTAIKASASALRQTELGADERDAALADVEDEADRLARLVGNLLDLSRIESGSLELRRSTVPMDELVFGAIEAAASRTQGHVVEASVPDGATVVTTDEPMIRQVLANLLENAAQHDRGAQPIRVEASLHPRRLELRVIDHGVGVPEAERQRIFEPYQRLKQGTQRKAGTGLGLVICKGFVEALGGTIRLETTAGGGATFVVSVPTEVVP